MRADAGTAITAGATGVLALVADRYFLTSGAGRPSSAGVGLLGWVVGDAEES